MKKWMSWMLAVSFLLAGITGCGKAEKVSKSMESGGTESTVGQGFKPPEGGSRDKRGFFVDSQGNTFDKTGGWQIPEGGHVDAQGRIYDRNGKMMGGGATVGSKG